MRFQPLLRTDRDRQHRSIAATAAHNLDNDLTGRTDTDTNETTLYQYDVYGNLKHVLLPNGTNLDYVVDGMNRRIGKKQNGQLIQGWLYANPLAPIAELDGQGHLVSRFVYADRRNVPSLMIKAGKTYRLIADHLGSTRLVINVQTGEIVQRMDYDVWGKVTLDTNPGFQPFGFAGGLYDRDTGLVRFGARDYDPTIGRWIAKDSTGFTGKQTNLYSFVFNDPINYVDSIGYAPNMNLFGPNEPGRNAMQNYTNQNGSYSITGHSNSMFMEDHTTRVQPGNYYPAYYADELAQKIFSDPSYHRGQPVELLGCHTATNPSDGKHDSLAQQLANKIKARVAGADDYFFPNADGSYTIAPRVPGNGPNGWMPDYANSSDLVWFDPK